VIEALKNLRHRASLGRVGVSPLRITGKMGLVQKINARPCSMSGGECERRQQFWHKMEFLNMCEELNAEPYLSVNVGSGSVQDVM
jgi:hypothetical protein